MMVDPTFLRMYRYSIPRWLLLISALTAGVIRVQAQDQGGGTPVLVQSVPAQTLTIGGSTASLDLSGYIHNPTVPGTAVRISVQIGTVSSGYIDVALTDQQTPLTVANFLRYVNAGAYANNCVHRSIPGFIIQDGGFYFPTPSSIDFVPTFSPVQNEPGLSNVRGTIAMAKLGSDPNSATSQWFINLADNSANLNNQNGGFTVFGHVIGNTMAEADAIAAVPTYDASTALNSNFTDLPLTAPVLAVPNFVQTSIAVIPGLTHAASAADGTLVTATISGNTLLLTPSAVKTGSTTVTVTSAALDGGQLSTTVGVTVTPPPSAPSFSTNPFSASVVAGQGASFAITAAGYPAPTLQWQSAAAGSGTFSNLTNGGAYSGVTTATLSVANTTVAMSGLQFRCTASNSVSAGITSAAATLTVSPAPATVTLSSLAPTYTGSPLPVTVATNPTRLAVTVTYSGNTTTAPTNAGSYPVTAVISDSNHTGSASGTLVIAPAAATVTLSSLTPTYTGTPLPVTVATNPIGLSVTVTYSGNTTTAPTNAGSYPVTAAITDPNHSGSASGTLVVAQAAQNISFGSLPAQLAGGAALTLTATASSGLTVTYASSNLTVATVSGNTVTPLRPGTTTITAAQAGNGNYLAASTVPQLLTVQPTFAAFASQYFNPAQLADPAVSGPTANPAHDGMSNLLKYALGLDPTQPDAQAGGPVITTAGGALTLTFVRPPGLTGITYVPEVSGDLQTWSSGPAATQTVSTTLLDAQHEQVVVRDLVPISGTAKRFIRLEVKQP